MKNHNGFIEKLVKRFNFSSKKDSNEEELKKIAAQEQKHFSFDVLVAATKNFNADNKLGEGGFGPVYKGKLDDGREIAVKKLARGSNQGNTEFMNEAKLLARVQHRNVVNLLGYCVNAQEKLLVYEYVANESLDKLLFKPNKRSEELDWNRRYSIISGVARGLFYLHEGSHTPIIHRDIKAGNILLDDKWVPKIADFGMARLFPEDQTHVNTRVAGTNGYMAPEYVMHGHLSAKADVYSFGVVVLELIKGQKNSAFFNLDSESLLDWAWKLHKEEKSLEIIDPKLASSSTSADIEQILLCIHIGLLCVQGDPNLRPTMSRTVVMLSRKPKTLDEPTRPVYPGTRYRRHTRRPRLSSSAVRTSEPSSSSAFNSSTGNNTTATTSTGLTNPLPDSKGERLGLSSSTVRTGESSSSTYDSSTGNTTTSGTTSTGLTEPLPDPKGKRPMES